MCRQESRTGASSCRTTRCTGGQLGNRRRRTGHKRLWKGWIREIQDLIEVVPYGLDGQLRIADSLSQGERQTADSTRLSLDELAVEPAVRMAKPRDHSRHHRLGAFQEHVVVRGVDVQSLGEQRALEYRRETLPAQFGECRRGNRVDVDPC